MARRVLATTLVVAALLVGASAPLTLARLTDLDASSQSISTDTLAPPTSVAAIGGVNASLTWTPSVDSYTAGYDIWRGTSSGGPYGLVGSVTPGTASSATDAPGAGVFYYMLRSSFQNWRSVNSNQTSATISFGPPTTGFKGCGSGIADTGGDGDGYETTVANACVDDSVVATDAGTGTGGRSTACANAANDRHRFGDFSLGLPGTVTAVLGIELRADVGLNNNGGTSNLCAELSWDGGTSWTAPKVASLTSSAQTTYLLGGPADPWGHVWTAAELTNANLIVRLTDATGQPNKDYRLDYLAVQVTYTP